MENFVFFSLTVYLLPFIITCMKGRKRAEEEFQALLSEYKKLKRERNRLRAELGELREKAGKLENTNRQLRKQINELRKENRALRRENKKLKEEKKDLEERLELLREQYGFIRKRYLNVIRRIYGKKSEKIKQEEKSREDLPEHKRSQNKERSRRGGERKRGHGRRPLPKELEVVREVIEPDPQELYCPKCRSYKRKIGESITKLLEYKPAQLFIREIVRPKYICDCNKGCIAKLPPRPQGGYSCSFFTFSCCGKQVC